MIYMLSQKGSKDDDPELTGAPMSSQCWFAGRGGRCLALSSWPAWRRGGLDAGFKTLIPVQ